MHQWRAIGWQIRKTCFEKRQRDIVLDHQTRSLCIIVADDDADMRTYYERTLRELGHRVVSSVENGRDLVDQVRENEPDVVITDVDMPGLDGLEAIECIGRHVCCIVVSAIDAPEPWPTRESSRCLLYLVKPICRRDLERAVAQVMVSLRDDVG